MAKYNRQISLGYDKNGNRIRKWAHGNTKSELNNNIDRIKKEFEEQSNPENITYHTYSEKWLDTYKKSKSPRTYLMYQELVAKTKCLNEYKMHEIKRMDIQNIISEYSDRPNTCKKILMCLRQIFKSALVDDIIKKDPTLGIESPKVVPKERRALSEKEKACLLHTKFDQKERLFINIMLNFGLRPGEALALTKDSFDFNNNTVTINKAVTFVNNDPYLKGTKTGVTRTLPIPSQLVPEIKKYLRQCENYLFERKEAHNGLMTKAAYKHFSDRIFEKINIGLGGSNTDNRLNGMTFYTFRHNKATALYYIDGISLKAKARYMGHSVDMLLKIYSHIDENRENDDKYNVF